MINYKLELKNNSKEYKCEEYLKIWTQRLNKIVKLGGEIISVHDYHKLAYDFKMPSDSQQRENILLHLIDIGGFSSAIEYDKKKDIMTVYYADGD